LAGAPAGRNPLRDLAGEFRFESYSLGQPRVCDSAGTDGTGWRRGKAGGKARARCSTIVDLEFRNARRAVDDR